MDPGGAQPNHPLPCGRRESRNRELGRSDYNGGLFSLLREGDLWLRATCTERATLPVCRAGETGNADHFLQGGGTSAVPRVTERPGSGEPSADGIGIYLHDISKVSLLDRVDGRRPRQTHRDLQEPQGPRSGPRGQVRQASAGTRDSPGGVGAAAPARRSSPKRWADCWARIRPPYPCWSTTGGYGTRSTANCPRT